jgi:hypothetical protein
MKRLLLFLALLLLIPPVSAAQVEWSVDLSNGYITTAPIIVDDQVIVRTSGFWSGSDRPHVYAFDLYDGELNWKYRSESSTQHDMSPLLYVKAGSGDCGAWQDMILVGWTDGKVTALDLADGTLVWQAQTEVITWGITGAMAIDSDEVVVPTRKGLSTFCLADGSLFLRVDLPQLGWRNGVSIGENHYLLGNEEGVLNKVYSNGTVENQSIGNGKIRHTPLQTNAGVLVHLQTDSGSKIFVDGELITSSGYSPAIPIIANDVIHGATSSEYLIINCNSICSVISRSEFHSNGEITLLGEEAWLARNTAEGGWGVFSNGILIDIHQTSADTYTTAGVGFGQDESIALGSDAGILFVSYHLQEETSTHYPATFMMSIIFLLSIISMRYAATFDFINLSKFLLLILMIISVYAYPQVANAWSNYLQEHNQSEDDWQRPWDDEFAETCEGKQAVHIELPWHGYMTCGLEGFETVEEITDAAAASSGIIIVKEQHNLGPWIVSFDGVEQEGWEFYIDGKRALSGISQTPLKSDTVVEWRMS